MEFMMEILIFTYFLISEAVKARPVRRDSRTFQISLDSKENKDEIIEINRGLLKDKTSSQIPLMEGDIILEETRGSDTLIKWPKSSDGLVRVPYILSKSYSSLNVKKITDAFADFQQYTCIRLVPRNGEIDYIAFNPLSGCYSNVGQTGGEQVVSLNDLCLSVEGNGTVQHELLHVLGFWHEHSRNDRDSFIDIIWSNIWLGYSFNFLTRETNSLVPYDYGSVMHYSPLAFSMNGNPTIVPKSKSAMIGQRTKLSRLDIQKVNLLYECAKVSVPDNVSTLKMAIKTAVNKWIDSAVPSLENDRAGCAPVEASLCDFEHGLSGWELNTAVCRWTVHRGPTRFLATGPERNVTLHRCSAQNEGNFLYINGCNTNVPDKAQLVSILLQGPSCISFMYQMNGPPDGSASLKVYKRSSAGTELLWTAKNGTRWSFESVRILSDVCDTYQVVFEGVTDSPSSEAAIDDVRVQTECYVYNEIIEAPCD
ncbi:astacin-like metalloendopeptidase isoform X2 [Amia ocellicauda]|uniref:astacin-like metalloendopeptidase isoform X2 n=1 Tax=Amia ocellicauda TaxID=2972642 RepID=UPI0034642F0A